MRVELRKQFIANLKGIRSRDLADDIEHLNALVEDISSVDQIAGIKKLTGYDHYYRIKVEDYRHQTIW